MTSPLIRLYLPLSARPPYFSPHCSLFPCVILNTKFTTTAANNANASTVGPNRSSNPLWPLILMLFALQWNVTSAYTIAAIATNVKRPAEICPTLSPKFKRPTARPPRMTVKLSHERNVRSLAKNTFGSTRVGRAIRLPLNHQCLFQKMQQNNRIPGAVCRSGCEDIMSGWGSDNDRLDVVHERLFGGWDPQILSIPEAQIVGCRSRQSAKTDNILNHGRKSVVVPQS